MFYVVSTWEEDWTTEDGRICHYADVYNPIRREHMAVMEIQKVAAYMSSGNRFYGPYYRHTTIETFLTLNEDTITVTLSPEHHVLVVSGYSGSEYKHYKNFLNVGDIHSCEPWLYSECLQKNINVRAKEWRKIHQLRH